MLSLHRRLPHSVPLCGYQSAIHISPGIWSWPAQNWGWVPPISHPIQVHIPSPAYARKFRCGSELQFCCQLNRDLNDGIARQTVRYWRFRSFWYQYRYQNRQKHYNSAQETDNSICKPLRHRLSRRDPGDFAVKSIYTARRAFFVEFFPLYRVISCHRRTPLFPWHWPW